MVELKSLNEVIVWGFSDAPFYADGQPVDRVFYGGVELRRSAGGVHIHGNELHDPDFAELSLLIQLINNLNHHINNVDAVAPNPIHARVSDGYWVDELLNGAFLSEFVFRNNPGGGTVRYGPATVFGDYVYIIKHDWTGSAATLNQTQISLFKYDLNNRASTSVAPTPEWTRVYSHSTRVTIYDIETDGTHLWFVDSTDIDSVSLRSNAQIAAAMTLSGGIYNSAFDIRGDTTNYRPYGISFDGDTADDHFYIAMRPRSGTGAHQLHAYNRTTRTRNTAADVTLPVGVTASRMEIVVDNDLAIAYIQGSQAGVRAFYLHGDDKGQEIDWASLPTLAADYESVDNSVVDADTRGFGIQYRMTGNPKLWIYYRIGTHSVFGDHTTTRDGVVAYHLALQGIVLEFTNNLPNVLIRGMPNVPVADLALQSAAAAASGSITFTVGDLSGLNQEISYTFSISGRSSTGSFTLTYPSPTSTPRVTSLVWETNDDNTNQYRLRVNFSAGEPIRSPFITFPDGNPVTGIVLEEDPDNPANRRIRVSLTTGPDRVSNSFAWPTGGTTTTGGTTVTGMYLSRRLNNPTYYDSVVVTPTGTDNITYEHALRIPPDVTAVGWTANTNNPQQFKLTLTMNEGDPLETGFLTIPSLDSVAGNPITALTLVQDADDAATFKITATLTTPADNPATFDSNEITIPIPEAFDLHSDSTLSGFGTMQSPLGIRQDLFTPIGDIAVSFDTTTQKFTLDTSRISSRLARLEGGA